MYWYCTTGKPIHISNCHELVKELLASFKLKPISMKLFLPPAPDSCPQSNSCPQYAALAQTSSQLVGLSVLR